MFSVFQAIVLGAIQGLTEFLPVSSSAHLILVPWLLRWQDPGLAFDVALHLGTLLARMARHGTVAGRRQPPPAPPAVSIDSRLSSRRHHRRPAGETSRDDLSIAAADRGHDGYSWAVFIGCRLVWLEKTHHR